MRWIAPMSVLAAAVVATAAAWMATHTTSDPPPGDSSGLAEEVRHLRGALDEQAARVEAMRAELEAETSRLRAGVDALKSARAESTAVEPAAAALASPPLDDTDARAELADHAARIARLERTAARLRTAEDVDPLLEASERARKAALRKLTSITDGHRLVAIQDALAELVRLGDSVVPDVVAALDSGIEQRYTGRFSYKGDRVDCYPGLRLVLYDVLRQIGSPASKKGLIGALARSENIDDLNALMTYWGTSDADVVDGVSAIAPDLLLRVAKVGLAKAVGDRPDSPTHSLLYWLYMHPPPPEILAPLEQIVLQGRPAGSWSSQMFESMFSLLARLAPEQAVQVARALQARDPEKGELFALSKKAFCALTPRARYCTALFSQEEFALPIRLELYDTFPVDLWKSPESWGGFKDAAAQIADAAPFVAFLEQRLAREPDERAAKVLRERLTRLREAIDRAKR